MILSRVTIVKYLSRVSNFSPYFFILLLLHRGGEWSGGAPQLWQPGSVRVAASSVVVFSVLFSAGSGAASVSGKPACFQRRLHLAACVVSVFVSMSVRVACGSALGLSRL